MEHFSTTIALIGIVIVVASLLSGALERSGIPLVAVFLALGAALGPWGLGLVNIGFESPALHALAMLGLALVLFSDAVTIDLSELRSRRAILWRVLGPGTIVPAILMALAAHLLLEVSWPAAAILGASLASTDPVLLRSVLRSKGLPPTPRVALRIETGMNDVVLLPIVVLSMLALPKAGGSTAIAEGAIARSIVGLFLLGPALGAAVGWLGIVLLGWVRDRVGVRRDYESLYALGLAFTAFAAAEGVGGSGFLAAFAAGLLVAWQDVELCDCFLEYGEATAEMLLLLTFVALGTVLIWLGLTVISVRTLLFAVVALGIRTVVLYPVLSRAGVRGRDRRLIAFFGPRGLSSLLLILLPVFAGHPEAESLFVVTSLVVLLSVVVHGTGMALFLRAQHGIAPATLQTGAPGALQEAAPAPVARAPLPMVLEAPGSEITDERITIDEMRALQDRGEEIIIVDARADRNRNKSDVQAAGSIRLPPDNPVRDAMEKRLSQRATLVIYCA